MPESNVVSTMDVFEAKQRLFCGGDCADRPEMKNDRVKTFPLWMFFKPSNLLLPVATCLLLLQPSSLVVVLMSADSCDVTLLSIQKSEP